MVTIGLFSIFRLLLSVLFPHCPFHLALCVPLGQGLALVVGLFALAQAQLYLHPAVLEVDRQRDQCIALLLLQVVVQFFARLRRRSYALTYAPSLLLLAWLTGIRSDVTTQVDFGSWWLAIPFLLLVIVSAIIQAMRYQPYEPDERRQGFLSQLLWINLGTLALMFLFVGFLSNNDREFHKRARMEYLVDQRRYREALVMAQRLERPDSVSSMLTIYSVARTGHLTDSLFHYRLVGEGKVMRPSPQVHSLLTPDSILNRVTSKSANYQLMGFLLDRDLPTFCAYLPLYYKTNAPMPRYYAEAWQLYHQLRAGMRPKRYEKGSYTYYYMRG